MKSPRVTSIRVKAVRAEHPLQWLTEPLLSEPTFELKSWFGGRSIMLHGQHLLFLTTRGEPWQGVLVCTRHEFHRSLLTDFPSLVQHPILGKWLYLPESAPTFERDAGRLVQLVRTRDPRVGIAASSRKKKAGKKIRFGDKL